MVGLGGCPSAASWSAICSARERRGGRVRCSRGIGSRPAGSITASASGRRCTERNAFPLSGDTPTAALRNSGMFPAPSSAHGRVARPTHRCSGPSTNSDCHGASAYHDQCTRLCGILIDSVPPDVGRRKRREAGCYDSDPGDARRLAADQAAK